ncbi:hypothetical protein PC129_g10812 [Phytophthora cactorum]|uniref:Uncharacterized protein n=1 Tax=Phytophthora cactorum TaxID=29920 RepID=A0A329SDZ8_9STRA|nr:hypothetical protein Pcac1_g4484 [Phytophthora cactorum]KAG2819141.1 hypothetical protein PC112_g12305 [Phytophthora cactorum]KAG2821010.1 hypothetical protein PC111_g11208 [Phytophthora cactorum]KAG2854929.1 hypothetical protein PC113_g12866 [Phytophthora cactorum]KAG2900666.1 hypothetical protein PC114_g13482 [Phytophthora cactorum]
MNVLLAEDNLDEKVADELPRASIGSAKKTSSNQNKKGTSNTGNGNAGKGKRQRGRGRYKGKGKDRDEKFDSADKKVANAGTAVNWVTFGRMSKPEEE